MCINVNVLVHSSIYPSTRLYTKYQIGWAPGIQPVLFCSAWTRFLNSTAASESSPMSISGDEKSSKESSPHGCKPRSEALKLVISHGFTGTVHWWRRTRNRTVQHLTQQQILCFSMTSKKRNSHTSHLQKSCKWALAPSSRLWCCLVP